MLNHWRIIWTHCNRFYRKKGCSDDDMPVMKFLKRWSCFVMNLIFFVVIRGQSTRSFMYIESKPWWKECHCISIMNMVSNFLLFTIGIRKFEEIFCLLVWFDNKSFEWVQSNINLNLCKQWAWSSALQSLVVTTFSLQ